MGGLQRRFGCFACCFSDKISGPRKTSPVGSSGGRCSGMKSINGSENPSQLAVPPYLAETMQNTHTDIYIYIYPCYHCQSTSKPPSSMPLGRPMAPQRRTIFASRTWPTGMSFRPASCRNRDAADQAVRSYPEVPALDFGRHFLGITSHLVFAVYPSAGHWFGGGGGPTHEAGTLQAPHPPSSQRWIIADQDPLRTYL